ncbi:MAG: TolC family protein [Thermodesulfobacteriota bacterium]|nr:TolC family protein [Thermodesulfobacteriota bacterium]
MYRLICICIICLGLLVLTNATYASELLSIEDAINIALANNPAIKALEEEVYGREMDRRSSIANMLPKVKLTYGYARLKDAPSFDLPAQSEAWLPVVNEQKPYYFNEDNPSDPKNNIVFDPATGTPALAYIPPTPAQGLEVGTKDNYDFTIEATQPIFTGGALWHSYKIAKSDVEVASVDKQRAIRELKLNVIETYYGLIEAKEFYEVAESGISSIAAHLNTAQAFYDQGMIPKNDLLEVQVRYAQAKQNLIMAENGVKLAESGLNLLLARDLSTPIVIGDEIPMEPLFDSLNVCTDKALGNRQELRSLRLQLGMSKRGEKIAKSVFVPSVAANYTYERTGEDPDVEDDTWTAGIGLSWSLFEGGSHYWQVSKAKSKITQLNHLIRAQRNQISLEVKSAYLSAEEAFARTKVATQAIDQAKENLRIQEDRYTLQVVTSTEVLDAQALLDQAKKNHISARADYAKDIAKLSAAMGIL